MAIQISEIAGSVPEELVEALRFRSLGGGCFEKQYNPELVEKAFASIKYQLKNLQASARGRDAGAGLEVRIRSALNSVSAENDSNTPDFILAQYLIGCLNAFNIATNQRTDWYDTTINADGPSNEA